MTRIHIGRYCAVWALILGAAMGTQADTASGDSGVFAFDTRIGVASAVSDSAGFVFDTRGGLGTDASGVSPLFAFDTRSGRVLSLTVGGPTDCTPGQTLQLACLASCDDGTFADVATLCDWWVDGAAPDGTFVGCGQFTAGTPASPTTVNVRAGYKRPSGYVVAPPFEVTIAKALTVQMGLCVATPNGSAGNWDLNTSECTVAGAYGSVTWQWQLDGVTLANCIGPALAGWRVTGAAGTRLLTVIATDMQGRRATASVKVVFNKSAVDGQPSVRFPAVDPVGGTMLGGPYGNPFAFSTDRIAAGLVVITHGYQGTGTDPWLLSFCTDAQDRLGSITNPIPNIAILDWHELADPSGLDSWSAQFDGVSWISWLKYLGYPELFVMGLMAVHAPATDQGVHLANWILAQVRAGNVDPSAPIQLIGHSAGGFVVSECAKQLRNIGGFSNIQVTTLDTPFIVPGDDTWLHPASANGAKTTIERYYAEAGYGTVAWWVGGPVAGTGYFEYDLKPQSWFPLRPTEHSRVHDWYVYQTTPSGADVQNGFYYSPFMQNGFHGQDLSAMSAMTSMGIAAGSEEPLTGFDTFGLVGTNGGCFRVEEEADAGILKTMVVPIGAQTVRFHYQFVSGGDGDFLTVRWGTNGTPLFVGSDMDLSRNTSLEGSASIAQYAGQTNQLIFTLVSRGVPNAVVEICDIVVTILDDADNDGLSNDQEAALLTDPMNPDTDGDGLTDGDEINVYHTNPLLADSDNDGVSDGMEIAAGTDPNDKESCFKVVRADAAVGGLLSIVWNGRADRTYRVNRRTDLTQRGYDTITTGVPGVAPRTEYVIPTATGAPDSAFYWVEME